MIVVVVGDKETVLPGLKALGYRIVELDDEGRQKGVLAKGTRKSAALAGSGAMAAQ